MDADLDTLATALDVRVDDALKDDPNLAACPPKGSFAPKLSDAELITLAVLQALAGFVSETRWLRYARDHLRHLFPYLPRQSGYNKRLRAAGHQLKAMIRLLAVASAAWNDDVWVIDSTPVECGRSRPTAKRSDTAGWSGYGYCASHSRYFWGLRLHLIATLHGLPVGFALTGAKADERQVLISVLAADPGLLHGRDRQILIADKNYYGQAFQTTLHQAGLTILRPARAREAPRPGDRFFRPLRQTIESIFDTAKGQLDLEAHGGHTITGVAVRVYQRLLALTAAIWHNHATGQTITRSLIAYDH